MAALKKANDPNYFLNPDAVMNEINQAFTTEPQHKESKYADLKAKVKVSKTA
jgi:hypothetical protein